MICAQTDSCLLISCR